MKQFVDIYPKQIDKLATFSFMSGSDAHSAQIVILAAGLALAFLGLSMVVHGTALCRTWEQFNKMTEFTIIGIAAGISGSLANLVQNGFGKTLGTLLGLIVGGALGGVLSLLMDAFSERISRLPPIRLTGLGSICLGLGIGIGILQLVVLAIVPTWP